MDTSEKPQKPDSSSAFKFWSILRKSQPVLAGIILWLLALGLVIGITLSIRTYAVQAFYIKSSSMEPTLQSSDRIFVNKLSYSLHKINRGDVVIINRSKAFQESNSQGIDDLIKRAIGLPGETVIINRCRVYINNMELVEPLELVEPYVKEVDTNSRAYRINCINNILSNRSYTVPEGHIFVLGDNRLNSVDSRVFGTIPESAIIGRAFVRVWPFWDISVL